jgi:hypothetical protein
MPKKPPAASLREYDVTITPHKPGPRLAYPDNLGLRTKFGGEPDAIQGPVAKPKCPDCSSNMSFVGQIDSFEHDAKQNPNRRPVMARDQHFMFCDVGLIYVWYCFGCNRPSATNAFY